MNKTIQELESEIVKLRREEYEQKRQEEYKKEIEFKAKEKIDVYASGDYCGLETPKYKFYYGYEHTRCLAKRHGISCVDDSRDKCEDAEWCFVAWENEKEIMRIPSSQLWHDRGGDMTFFLLAGIGKLFETAVTLALPEVIEV